MLKITSQREPTLRGASLVIEGRLAGLWVEELRAFCLTAAENRWPCSRIELTNVTFIDEAGKELLAQLWQQGVELLASGCLTRRIVEEITGMSAKDGRGEADDTCH